MFLRYLLNAIIISFCSQIIASGKLFLTKRGNFIKNVMCIFFMEELIGSILQFFSILNPLLIPFIDIIVLISSIIFFIILSIACYYIHEFRGTNLNFQDIMSIPTAKEVAGGYDIKIKTRFEFVIGFYILYVALSIFLYKYDLYDILLSKTGIKESFTNLEFKQILSYGFKIFLIWLGRQIVNIKFRIFFLIFSFLCLKYLIISKHPYNYGLFAGEKEGYIYNFFSSIPLFHKNKKYINEKILYSTYLSDKTKYNENNVIDKNSNDYPHIICIMNESFGLSHNLIKTNYEVTPYYNSLNNVIKGNMYVNTIGGGTCNTEYDFLTYSNVGDFDYPIYPYNNLVKKKMYALPQYFKNIGYETIAFHPYTKTNYNRHKVYKRFGFDDFINIKNMTEKQLVRNYISDECMYNKVNEILDEHINFNRKLFLYGVTIQNHGGYKYFEGENIQSTDERFKNTECINSYLSLVRKSDDAIHILIDHIKNIDSHVVILFFGDHNATYDTNINRKIYGDSDNYEMSEAYKVPFFIYDNKNNLNEFVDKISPNFLALRLLKSINMPLDYDLKYMDDLYNNIKCMNYHKMLKANSLKPEIIPPFEYKILQKLFVLKKKNRLI